MKIFSTLPHSAACAAGLGGIGEAEAGPATGGEAEAAGGGAGAFVLEEAPAKLTMADQERYSQKYGKGWRTIRRWVEKGEADGDPCPLHDAEALRSWWGKHMTWRVPAEIEAAATAAAVERQAAAAQIPTPPPAMAGGVAGPAVAPGPAMRTAIDIDAFDPAEGSRLRELQQVQAAKFSEWKDALARGDVTADELERKYLKLSETIDKMEVRLTARMHKQGLFILRSQVEADLAASAELLRQSAEAMERRVLELCPGLSDEHRAEVSSAIRRARDAEARTFVRLPTLKTDDLLRELQAVA